MKETLLKFKKIWEERKAKGDKQADAKLAKIEKSLKSYESSAPIVLETIAEHKKGQK